mgnify:CR=1 FL=1
MAAQHTIEPGEAVHQAATQLMEIDWIDQETARRISQMAEAVANMFTIVYYQAETGLACREDFLEAQDTLRRAMPLPYPA